MSKEIRVVKKEKDEIELEEVNKKAIFFKRYRKYALLLLLLFFIVVGTVAFYNLSNSNDYIVDNPQVDVEFPDGDDIIIDSDDTDKEDNTTNNDGNSTGNNTGNNGSNTGNNNVVKDPDDVFDEFFNVPDEVALKTKTIKLSDKTISYYSDYSAKIVYNDGKIVRVLPIDNKSSVDEQGNINPTAKKSIIKITKIEATNHGTITYYSDHSAEAEDKDLDIWVGKKENIKEYYITENKISYSSDIKEYDSFTVTYYHDGTIFITDNNKKYFVRDEKDVTITEEGYKFNYDNHSEVIETKRLNNDFTVDYLSDGGAIVEGPNGNVSVRKSNSIIIENNELIKIKLSNQVKETSKKKVENKEITYYDNGSSIVKQEDKVIGYVEENSDLKIKDEKIENNEVINSLVNTSTPNKDETIYVFDDGTAFIENKSNDINLFDKSNNVVIDNGVVAIINSDAKNINLSNIRITNNSKNKVKIRVVLEDSKNTTLQSKYFNDVKYKISAENIEKSIINNPWDNKELDYILYETELDSKEEVNYQLAVWLDYENLNNDAMGKYFYGTLKVYSWEQK